jgi:hypothetical protein
MEQTPLTEETVETVEAEELAEFALMIDLPD